MTDLISCREIVSTTEDHWLLSVEYFAVLNCCLLRESPQADLLSGGHELFVMPLIEEHVQP